MSVFFELNSTNKVRLDFINQIEAKWKKKTITDPIEIIINLEKWCNITLLSGIVDNQIDVSKAMSVENIKKITALNEINKFKTTLVETMTYLDSQ